MGWDGWDGNARTTSGRPGLGQLLAPPSAAAGLGKGAAAAGTAGSSPELLLRSSRLPKLGEKSCKKSFSARGSGSLPHPGAFGVSLPRSGRCSWVSGLPFVQLGLELGLERDSQKLWNPQNHFQHLKLKDLPGLPAGLHGATESGRGLPIPFPRLPSLQALWGECGVSGAALSPV